MSALQIFGAVASSICLVAAMFCVLTQRWPQATYFMCCGIYIRVVSS